MVVCPSCGSSRIRNDYKPAPLWLRLMGVRGLLCDNCNFPFRAFSPLPPKSRRPRHAQRKADVFSPAPPIDLTQIHQNPLVEKAELRTVTPPEKLELRVAKPSAEKFEFVTSSSPSAPARIVTDYIAPVRSDLRTEITRIHAQGIKQTVQVAAAGLQSPEQAGPDASSQGCPECGSRNVRRRRRNIFERTLLSFSDHKAYSCRNCGASFYAKREERDAQPAFPNSVDAAAIESSCFNVGRAEQKG